MNKSDSTASPKTLLVLAAGMGSRYGGLKQIDPRGASGETLLDYSIYDARQADFSKLVFVIRHSMEEQFRAIVGRRYEKLMEVDYVFQELEDLPAGFEVPVGREKPWGTGHAILVSEKAIREPFAVINADDFYGRDSYRVLSQFLDEASHSSSSLPEYALVGYVLDNTLSDHGDVSRGICKVDSDGYLETVQERTSIRREGKGAVSEQGNDVMRFTGDELVSLNLWGFTPALFAGLRETFVEFLHQHGKEVKSEFFIPSAVDSMIARKKTRVRVLQTSASWLGVTYREDKPLVQAALARMTAAGEYPQPLL